MIYFLYVLYLISIVPSLVYAYYVLRLRYIYKFNFRKGFLGRILVKESEAEVLQTENAELIKEYYILQRIEKASLPFMILFLVSFVLIVYFT